MITVHYTVIPVTPRHSMARNTTPRPDRYRVIPVTSPIAARSCSITHRPPLVGDPGHGDPSCKIRASGAEPVLSRLARILLQYSTIGNTCKEYANLRKPVRPGWHDPCKGADRDPGHTTPIDKKKPGINPGSLTPAVAASFILCDRP